MEDYQSKYSGEQVEAILDSVANGEAGGGGGGITVETDPIFSASPAASITGAKKAEWDAKQERLISGTNIKTINGKSILGEGDIIIEEDSSDANVQAVDTTETLDDVETNTYVKYVAQTLTEEQKSQVRSNIGVNLTDYAKKEDLSNYYNKSEVDDKIVSSITNAINASY